MKIDAAGQRPFTFVNEQESVKNIAPNHQGRDSVSLAALNSSNDAAATSMVSGMITQSASSALAAHSRLDPERALRLLGLID